jgi:subtilase family serine protease
MRRRQILTFTVLLFAMLVICMSQSTGNALPPETPVIRLPSHLLPGLGKATEVTTAHLQAAELKPLTITIVLKRDRQQEFEQYLHELYDPHSKNFHHFLTQTQISAQFGPSLGEYDSLLGYLRRSGFRQIERSSNRLTITAQARRADAERALSR